MPLPVLAHVSLGTNHLARAKAFYDAVLGTLQIKCVMSFPFGAGYGRKYPEFWIQQPHDHKPAVPGNGVHVCFMAGLPQEVDAFHAMALEMGGADEGRPGFRKEYSPEYYAAFARDPDGNKIEAVCFIK